MSMWVAASRILLAKLIWSCQPAAAGEGPIMMAASSLTDVMEVLADDFAAETGLPRPTLSFAGSSRLARQLIEGAPGDLAITADAEWMDVLLAEGVVRRAVPFV